MCGRICVSHVSSLRLRVCVCDVRVATLSLTPLMDFSEWYQPNFFFLISQRILTIFLAEVVVSNFRKTNTRQNSVLWIPVTVTPLLGGSCFEMAFLFIDILICRYSDTSSSCRPRRGNTSSHPSLTRPDPYSITLVRSESLSDFLLVRTFFTQKVQRSLCEQSYRSYGL